MITNFEDQTSPLTGYEEYVVVPALVDILKDRKGADMAISNSALCGILQRNDLRKINEPRIRKCINFIRTHRLVPHLIANGRGYYCATYVDEVVKYINSLEQRASAIIAVKVALQSEVDGKIFI